MAFADLSARNARDCANGIVVVQSLWPEGNASAVQVAVNELVGTTPAVQVYPSNVVCPQFATSHVGAYSLVACYGIQSIAQGFGIFAGASFAALPVGGGLVNAACLAAANRILDALAREVQAVPRNWFFLGHSYGGAIVQLLAILLRMGGYTANDQILTFGAPRVGDVNFTYRLPILNNRRFFNAYDPVPRFPPHLAEAPATSVALGPAIITSYQSYAQGPGGTMIFDNGTMQAAELPLRTLPDTGATLIGWATGTDMFASAQHNINTYVANLSLAAQTRFAASPLPPTPSAPEPVIVLSTVELKEQLAKPLPPSPSLLHTGDETVAYLPPTYLPSAQNVGGTWCVVWNSFVVMKCSKRTTAKSISKYLRSYLRRQQACKSLSSMDWQNAWQAYLQAAARADLGFNPPLVVT